MYPPHMLYDIARQQQAEEVARAEQWRRRPRRTEPRRHFATDGFRQVLSPRHLLARVTAAHGAEMVPRH